MRGNMSKSHISTLFWTIFCILAITACQPKPLSSVQLIDEPTYIASLSSDGKLALISTAQHGLQLWNIDTYEQKYTWSHQGKDNDVIATSLSPNKKFAASMSRNSVVLWDINNGQSLGWWSLPSSGQAVAVADNGQLLVGLNDGSVISLNHQQQGLIKFLGHTEKVNSVAISADGKIAITGANDKTAIAWHTKTGQPIQRWPQDSRVIKVSISHDGQLAFINDSTNVAQVLSVTKGFKLSSLRIIRRKMNFSAARFSHDGKYIYSGTPAREVMVWDSYSGKNIAKWQVTRTNHAQIKGAVVYSVTSNNKQQIISFSSNGLVEIWPAPIH